MTSDRDALRALLTERAFLSARDGHVLRAPNGASLPWIFYGPAVSLTAEGSTLMAAALLDALKDFSSTQLATCGTSAISILGACLALGEGRYSGLTIRKVAKTYGACRRIDGPLDRTRSVVVIDESITSGRTVYDAICALEAEGVEVEGVVCIVDFSGYGTVDWLSARGYRVKTIFDVWRDLERPAASLPASAIDRELPWHDDRVPDGLSPAQVVRVVAETYRHTDRIPRPPARLDRHYEGGGGTFVSVRRRSDNIRLVREGFRRDVRDSPDLCHDVVRAAWMAVASSPVQAVGDLTSLKFAVAFLGAPERITPAQIEPNRFALLVRALEPMTRAGFALPNAPHYDDEIEQYAYATRVSASFWHSEPHELFRQSVERSLEPADRWPAAGAPTHERHWAENPALAQAIAHRVDQILRLELLGQPPTDDVELPSIDASLGGVGVSLYAHGLIGCWMSFAPTLNDCLTEATTKALHDARYAHIPRPTDPDALHAVVSLLHERQFLGNVSTDRVKLFFRPGRHTLLARVTGKSGLVLAHFATHQSLDADAYVEQVLRKAGIADGQVHWTSFETASWIAASGRGSRLSRGMRVHESGATTEPEHCVSLIRAAAQYVLNQRSADGLPAYFVSPWSARRFDTGTGAAVAMRVLLGIAGLLEARTVAPDLVGDHAARMVGLFVRDHTVHVPRGLVWGASSDAQLLSNVSLLTSRESHTPLGNLLVERLLRLIRSDGAIYEAGRGRMVADLDFLSGSTLVALARAAEWLPGVLDSVDLNTVLAFYRERFARAHPWAMVWWHTQAWMALSDRVDGARRLAFDMVDWALEWQNDASGAFTINLEPRQTSFLTACVLEGVADAWSGALRIGDSARATRYQRAWQRGLSFVERLIMRDDDAFFSPDAASVVGGVRATLNTCDVRIDYVGHTLIALSKGARILTRGGNRLSDQESQRSLSQATASPAAR